MLSTPLPDGCSSQMYADKCNLLVTQHLPYFQTVRLEGEHLSKAYLKFLPASLSSEARSRVQGAHISRVRDRAGSFQIPVSQLQPPRQREDSSMAVSKFQIPEPTSSGVVERVVADSRFQIPDSALARGPVRGQIPDSRFQGGSPEILHRDGEEFPDSSFRLPPGGTGRRESGK